MPLPYNRKLLGFKQVYQPFFAQQLGVFFTKNISQQLLQQFLIAIPTNYKRIYTQVNTSNMVEATSRFQVAQKPNYILDLHLSYLDIRRQYSKGLKYNIKQAQKANLLVQQLSIPDFIAFYEANPMEDGRRYNHQLVQTLQRLLPILESQKVGFAKGVFDDKQQLIAASFILKSHQRLIYLLARSNAVGRQYKAMPFLLDTIIEQYAHTETVLDFEGSAIPTVAKFFRSFGAKEEFYYSIALK